MVEREKFIKIINEIQDHQKKQRSKEVFSQIKDNILYLQNYNIIGIKCNICKETGHFSTNCDKTNYKPSIIEILEQRNLDDRA